MSNIENKYELINTYSTNEGKLYRIRALKNITTVNGDVIEKGTLGGYVESEENLSQTDNSWIYIGSFVKGKARVYGNSIIGSGNTISGNARIFNTIVSDNIDISGDTIIFNSNIVAKDGKLIIKGKSRLYSAKIKGYGVIKDNVVIQKSTLNKIINLSDNVRVSNSTLYSSIVSDYAYIINSEIVSSTIMGNAVVIDSKVYKGTIIQDNATVERSTVSHISMSNNSRAINSVINWAYEGYEGDYWDNILLSDNATVINSVLEGFSTDSLPEWSEPFHYIEGDTVLMSIYVDVMNNIHTERSMEEIVCE